MINKERSYTEYNVEVPTTDFPIGFDILDDGIDVVAVTLNDVDPTTLGYTVIQVNNTTYRFAPAVPSGVVRLTRITDIDKMAHVFTEGAIFISENMDGNFKQIRHAQQEVRDGFNKLSANTNEIIDTLQVVGEAAKDAADAAEAAAQAANDAAARVNDKVSYQDLDNAVEAAVTPVKVYIALPFVGSKTYSLNERVQLENGVIVKSTIGDNTVNPNVDMTGWGFDDNTVESIVDLIAIQNPKDGQVLTVKNSSSTGESRTFVYDSSRVAENNGGTIFNGWVFEYGDTLKTSWWGLPKENSYNDLATIANIAKEKGLFVNVDVAGVYDLKANYFPVRNPLPPSASSVFADYNGMTIRCVSGVTFKTTAITGQDVFQLNSVKGFKLLGFPKITSTITDFTGAGSNAVSLTNGCVDVYMEVDVENLPQVVKSNYVDGGKAVSLQTGGTTSLRYENVEIKFKSKNTAYGFNADINSKYLQSNPIKNVKISGLAEDAYRGVAVVLDQSAVALNNSGLSVGIVIDITTVNCQQHYIEQRAWHLESKITVINTKPKSELLRGVSYDTEVFVDSILGKKYGSSVISGSVQDVDVLHRLGGTGSNGGVGGRTSNADIQLSVNFNSATIPFDLINSGGNIVENCNIYIDNVSTIPPLLFSNANTLVLNGGLRSKDLAAVSTFRVLDTITGNKRFGVRSDGHLEIPLTTGAVGTTSAGRMAVYNRDNGNFIGYIPIFSA